MVCGKIYNGLDTIHKTILVFTCCLLLNTFPVFGEYSFDTGDYFVKNKGYFGFEFRHFLQDPVFVGQHDQWSKFEGAFDLSFKSINNWGIRLNPRILFSFEEEKLDFLHLDNVYAFYEPNPFRVRAGSQIFLWSVGKGTQPANVLNQTYKPINVLNPAPEGELSLDLSYKLGSKEKHKIELIYLPYFTPSEYPNSKNRYYLFGDPDIPYELKEDTSDIYQDSKEQWRPQGAVRWQSQFSDNISMSAFYFNGYEKIPGFVQVTNYGHMMSEYRLVHRSGINAKYGNDDWGIYGEAVRTDHQKSVQLWNDSPNGKVVELVTISPFYEGLLGAEYFFRAKTDWHIILEVNLDTDKGREPEDFVQFKPLRNCVYLGFEKIAFESNGREFSAGYYLNYQTYDGVLQIGYTEKILEHFSVKAAWEDVITVNKSEDNPLDSHLKPLGTTRRLSIEALLGF